MCEVCEEERRRLYQRRIILRAALQSWRRSPAPREPTEREFDLLRALRDADNQLTALRRNDLMNEVYAELHREEMS